jgi:peptidyl-dipeptidase A
MPRRLTRTPIADSLLISLALVGCGGPPLTPAPPYGTPGAAEAGPVPGSGTPQEAATFVEETNRDLRELWTAEMRAEWIAQTYINQDSAALAAAAKEERMGYLGQRIPETVRFQGVALPPEIERQIYKLRLASTLPAPRDADKRKELAELEVAMTAAYGEGEYCSKQGGCKDLGELSKIMAKSKSEGELLEAWTGWRTISPPLRPKYQRFVELANEGAREIGFDDLGELWRSGYDMPPDAFRAEVDRLWEQVAPLYEQLHCHVRSQLQKRYGAERIAAKGPIPAHLLGNMWAQDWSYLDDLVMPHPDAPQVEVTKGLERMDASPVEMVKMGESFFTSLGLAPLPETFWERSLFEKPADREVVCHASAWDVTLSNDLRIKMCIQQNEEDLITIHHELGHNYYFMAYNNLPPLLQEGANDGFHEGIGDTLALSVTPAYLAKIGVLPTTPDQSAAASQKAELNVLMKTALSKIAFLPFGKLVDEWRWRVFSGEVSPDQYNAAWWKLRHDLQGVAPPTPRGEEHFDPGAKYHVPANTPYMRYFLAHIYQFQFHRALCKAAGHTGPLHTCSIYGSKEAGKRLWAMLQMGASRPWPDALEALTGERRADATALLDYFAPLSKWLEEQNKGQTCGW